MDLGIVPVYQDVNKISRINFSRFFSYEEPKTVANAIAIKYVSAGSEGYEVNNKQYEVGQGQYLLIDKGNSYTTFLNGSKRNEGLCIYIDPALTANIIYVLTKKEEVVLEHPMDFTESSVNIVEGLYNGIQHDIGCYLQTLTLKASAGVGQKSQLFEEPFYELASALVRSQLEIQRHIYRVPAKKFSVQLELYKRIEEAKDYIHNCLGSALTIEELAIVAKMSPFHFMRTFRRIYGVPVYQYILEKRLYWSLSLIKQGKMTITEIAAHTGFADVFSFSKAFKKRFGHAPRFYNTDKQIECVKNI